MGRPRNLTFVADDYEINFDKLSEGEEDDQYTGVDDPRWVGKFRVRSRSVPARGSLEAAGTHTTHRGPAQRSRATVGSEVRPHNLQHSRRLQSTGRLRVQVLIPCDANITWLFKITNCQQHQLRFTTSTCAPAPQPLSVLPGVSMVFSEEDRRSLEEPRDSLTGRRRQWVGPRMTMDGGCAKDGRCRHTIRIPAGFHTAPMPPCKASEEWCTKSLTSRVLHRGKKDHDSCVTCHPSVQLNIISRGSGVDSELSLPVTSRASGMGLPGAARCHGRMEWVPGHTLHFDVALEVTGQIHLEVLLPDGFGQGIVDGKVLLDAPEKYEQVQLQTPGAFLGLQVRMKPSKQRGTKKGLKWHPEVRDGKSFTGTNRRNTPFQPMYPIAESEARMSEARISDGMLSEARMSEPRMSEARMSDGRLSDPRMSEARMSDGRLSDPRMSEARMSDGRLSDPRMSEARMSDGRLSDPRMSEARMSDSRLSDPCLSGRMSNVRASAARSDEDGFLHVCPSTASMQLDVADQSPRSSLRNSATRPSQARNCETIPTRLADGTVKMQQDPADASDSSASQAPKMSLGASLNHVTSRMSTEAQSGSMFSMAPQNSASKPLRHSMQVASESETASSQGSQQAPHVTSMATINEDRSSKVSSAPGASSRASRASRASRLGRRSLDADQAPGVGVRAVCRFTHPQAVDFCGLELVSCQCQAETLAGRDRSALLVLLEQAGKSVEAARKMKGSGPAASAMPRLVAQLSSELTLHGRELRSGRLQAVGSEPVFLAVLSQLVEVLDTLVPQQLLPENSLVLGTDGTHLGGEARPPYTESLLESLRQSFGPHGFLVECVECLRSHQLDLPANVTQQALALLALRLALCWDSVPSTVPRPLELVLQQRGGQVLLEHLAEVTARLTLGAVRAVHDLVARLALALEALHLVLCSDEGLQQLCSDATWGGSGGSAGALATLALETMDLLAQQSWKAPVVGSHSHSPRLPCNRTAQDGIVRALCQLISPETLTPCVAQLLPAEVQSPQKPRIWLGSVARHRSGPNKVPSMVAIAAKVPAAASGAAREVRSTDLALVPRIDDAGPVSKAVEKRASQPLPEAAGSYYDTVEAFVSEVYGSNGAMDVEEEMADFRPRLRCDW
eukprot:Skav201763  [mRNA]  locus=scaffold1973:378459:418749:- [translate_table: standard]